MHFRQGRLVTSASDLTVASNCEFAFLRALDARLGRLPAVVEPDDAMLERAGRLGDVHETRILERYRAERPDGDVRFIERPDPREQTAVEAAVAETLAAVEARIPVIAQATFADEHFIGFADFLVLREGDDGVARYVVQDAKLARRAKVTALLQLAAYAERLDLAGVPRSDEVELLLGDGSTSVHRVVDLMPVFRLRRDRLDRQIAERFADESPVAWGAPDVFACGRCATCTEAVVAARDLFLVASLRRSQRERLRAAGIRTIDDLAASTGDVTGVGPATLAGLRTQAQLQLQAELLATSSPDPDHAPPPVEVVDAAALAAIPEPSPGDLFFDFEGDPLYTEDEHDWGIDYLFGMVDDHDVYTALWAHDFAEERVALERFLELVAERRTAHPGLHIYHYAAYERTHLASIAARHGVGEAEVDALLREGVLVDLYPIVKRSIRVGSRSYSIKKLEPLYMGDEHREADVQAGGDSITAYVEARDLLGAVPGAIDPATGRPAAELGQEKLDDLADYNRYDCVSTLRLRDWLQSIARARGVAPLPPIVEPEVVRPPSPLAAELLSRAGGPAAERGPEGRSDDETALALASAAIEYHRREAKSFWLEHYLRLAQPIENWGDDRDVFIVDPRGRHESLPWGRSGGQRVARRRTRLAGTLAPGSSVKAGDEVFALYRSPAPFPVTPTAYPLDAKSGVRVVEVDESGSGIVIEETASGAPPWTELPVAITPGPPPSPGAQEGAIEQWATAVLDAQPDWPIGAAADLLRRVPPRVGGAALAPVVDGDVIGAVADSLLDLDRSYLAVQGPPGTGKTYVGSHVIARLVARHGWRVGVVAQSHAVVEHLLDRVVAAGLPAASVGKARKSGAEPGGREFTELDKSRDVIDFIARQGGAGFVVGGTAWTFANNSYIARGSLDLLVIDEAGQFALAPTIAAGAAAQRLLLLGDPQQLPQVSQGIHPEPVDGSALGWIAAGHDVLPRGFGYFLAESRRMHPDVAQPVSELSYEGALRSYDGAAERLLVGVEPGLHVLPVRHEGNSTDSPEEAVEVVRLASSLLGRPWQEVTEELDASTGEIRTVPVAARPLAQRDLIVVTPYNAQLQRVRAALDAAGLRDVPVGTVDKFQGQEAAVAIVSLAASSAEEVPRGLDFLLLPNRLNVAISRAKWAAYLLYSPGLLQALPHTPVGVARLSRFARLVDGG
ncbi:TM0106 family RecB-like putative nuclease [Agromyces seonyuensis]|uniref:TM0106 family RecB-like putative nuclease n=1 Tax=Agromyces seonyuensis TaxID=2662446 RepID=A0A6I4NZC8_9MICO|nr:bifunctional RecB family nuclease/DEAD/DEAH box helicase [Agromyces seonyuensis]MWB99680.1 TM0106 family RecB-like putative nuclease [Agromyces seonyuensis]